MAPFAAGPGEHQDQSARSRTSSDPAPAAASKLGGESDQVRKLLTTKEATFGAGHFRPRPFGPVDAPSLKLLSRPDR